MRVALYSRTSTQDQNTEMQIQALRAEASRRGWKVVLEHEEKSSSRKKLPLRDDIVRLARERKIDAVMVWALDRWARSLVDGVLTVTELFECGVAFVTCTGMVIDLTTPEGKLQFHVMQAFAEFEREQIRRRVKAGIANYRQTHAEWGPPKTAQAKAPQVLKLAALGWAKREIARTVGIDRRSVDRILAAHKAAAEKAVSEPEE